ncbi:hypothetical protein K466DRAFT_592980 [Polyporus arcularius HHB13444]|uniref:Uncharacterized protein n=1 Tax=Polyporus arcularius HHB13444 TaxID=1314778 RepID=A0A5C3NK17_9APHY|nr:hypothetical protein K466DRAFT_592980 [Polyporus arcularius HHB13444]
MRACLPWPDTERGHCACRVCPVHHQPFSRRSYPAARFSFLGIGVVGAGPDLDSTASSPTARRRDLPSFTPLCTSSPPRHRIKTGSDQSGTV